MKRCKVWKLKQVETKAIFSERVQARAALIRKEPGDVEKVWKDLKDCFLEEAVDVCGETRGIARQKETWWWNEEVAALVKEKQLYSSYGKGLRSARKDVDVGRQEGKSCMGVGERLRIRGVAWTMDMETRRQDYNQARDEAKRAIFKAKKDERKRFGEELEREDDKGNLF